MVSSRMLRSTLPSVAILLVCAFVLSGCTDSTQSSALPPDPCEDLICDDGDICTTDRCRPGVGCEYDAGLADGTTCHDGAPCRIGEICNSGICGGGKPLACDDANVCTSDACDPTVGCVFNPTAATCDDGDECTSNDVCSAGACRGSEVTCPAADGPCQIAQCVAESGCSSIPVADGTACGAESPCTLGQTCQEGSCEGGVALACDDANECTSDACDPSVGCVFTPQDVPCDDGSICTSGDHCQAGSCVSSDVVNCSDGNPCTVDDCLEDGSCESTQAEDGASCGEDGSCVSGGCQLPTAANCLAHLLADPNAPNGTYSVDADGEEGPMEPFEIYCDMTTDGGGWTLVMRDLMDGEIGAVFSGDIGDVSTLASLNGPGAKLSDDAINGLRSLDDGSIGYRTGGPGYAYFFPSNCTYKHDKDSSGPCMRFAAEFEEGPFVTYIQCVNSGGWQGGLQAWFRCGPVDDFDPNQYTNVVKTHSHSSKGGACITFNPAANPKGMGAGTVQTDAPPGCGYDAPLHVWVR
jgi:hypothetical protein